MRRAILVLLAATVCAVTGEPRTAEVRGGRDEPELVVREGTETIFRHRFEKGQAFHAVEISPSGSHVLAWHDGQTPRRLTVFSLSDGRMTADFAPGFGGELLWTRGDVILHRWGCGTNCVQVRSYDVRGKTLTSGSFTGALLTRDGFFLSFPTIAAALDHKLVRHDARTGKQTVLLASFPMDAADVTVVGEQVHSTVEGKVLAWPLDPSTPRADP